MNYTKQPIDYPGQISILKKRGLIVDDDDFALRQLGIISYFRLASYWQPMESDKINHIFKPNSTFKNAVSLYYFDKQLRALIFTLVQSIEIALRTKVITSCWHEVWGTLVHRQFVMHKHPNVCKQPFSYSNRIESV